MKKKRTKQCFSSVSNIVSTFEKNLRSFLNIGWLAKGTIVDKTWGTFLANNNCSDTLQKASERSADAAESANEKEKANRQEKDYTEIDAEKWGVLHLRNARVAQPV